VPDFDEKFGQVTGAGSKVGHYMAELYSQLGAKVLVADVNDIPAHLELNSEDVHIWWASLDLPRENLSKLIKLLSDDEKARAWRFHFEHHRLRYIAGRAYLRQLLGGYLGLRPAQIEFDYNPLGKPVLKNISDGQVLQFNLSNSEDRVLISFNWERLIGIDLEFIHPVPDKDNIARQFFCESECDLLSSLSGEAKSKTFFELWTCKESLLKAMGTGLTAPINEVEIALNNGNARLVSIATDPSPAADWQFRLFQPAPGYQAALTVKGLGWKPTFYHAAGELA
jgi:4'-phosphopantetheinyl transferase